MTLPPAPPPVAAAPEPRAAHGRGVAATWWYTFLSAAFFAAMFLGIWAIPVFAVGGWTGHALYAAGALAWSAAFVTLGMTYRHAERMHELRVGRARLGLLLLGAVAAVGVAVPTMALAPFAALILTLVCMLPWQRGIRGRITALCTLLIAALAWIDAERVLSAGLTAPSDPGWLVVLAFAVALPFTVVSMLWWWDIVRELDRTRAAEARLAATQERLRLAGEVHDLQGHHLQVIALQLELAERLIHDDAASALTHLRAAQGSVDEARTGTRELATRFRGVPLPDELANAADLLRAAGLRVELAIDPDAARAPRDVLGPVVRECTTNILKHGGGRSAALTLEHDGGLWRFRAINDLADAAPAVDAGAGLSGMDERIAQAGGRFTARRRGRSFEVVAELPEEETP